MRIAICDDVKIFLVQLKAMLIGYYPYKDVPLEIDEFSSGEELLKVFSADRYDAVILDVEMKAVNGLQTAHEIRKADELVTIAFHTSYNKLNLSDYEIGRYIHMEKGQSNKVYQEQFSELFSCCGRNAGSSAPK